jgi:hypothetical protein
MVAGGYYGRPPPGGIDGGLDAVTDPELSCSSFSLVGDEVRIG